ncbi:MFS general substrate transporter [Thozetella sp. PMI_491]|nr:MFS general substrate transporter [Thozetella sp. PMI_491]
MSHVREGSVKSGHADNEELKEPNPEGAVSVEIHDAHLVRKIDKHLLPFMIISYLLQYLDKTSLGYAAVTGIQAEIGLVGQDYSWSSSMFYFGYLVASYPASYGFVKLPLAKFLGVSMILWSIVLICHGAVQNFGGLMALRFLLGATESTISPGFSLLTSIWYTPSEHTSRHALWFAGNSIALAFGSLLGYGIGHAQGTIAPWRLIFIIFGVITLAWSVVVLVFLPDAPESASFLTEDERTAVIVRSQQAQATHKSGKYVRSQVLEALVDPKTWFLFSYTVLSSLPNGCFTNFSSIIISGFGFNTLTTILLSMPSAGFQLIYTLGGAFLASKLPKARCLTIAGLNSIGLIGCLLIRQLPHDNQVGRLFGIYLFGAYAGGFPISLSLIASNIGGFTKRGTVTAILFLGYCAGNIGGPQMFLSKEAPDYHTAFTSLLICFCLAVASILALALYMNWQNKKRENEGAVVVQDMASRGAGEHLVDETDWENKHFRYCL